MAVCGGYQTQIAVSVSHLEDATDNDITISQGARDQNQVSMSVVKVTMPGFNSAQREWGALMPQQIANTGGGVESHVHRDPYMYIQ